MLKIVPLLLSLLTPLTAQSQSITYEAVRLSEIFLDSTWSSQEQSIPLLIAGIEAQLRQAGASERVATVFPRELKRSLNRDNLGKAFAAVLSQQLTSDESKDLIAFLQSSLGRKYLSLSKEITNSPAFSAQLFKPACDQVTSQLSSSEKVVLQSFCGH